MAFNLNSYPIVYRACYDPDKKSWCEEYVEKPHKGAAEEAKMSAGDFKKLSDSRNFWDDVPLVTYTTQYAMSCFEGMKAMPQKDGGLAIFRPDQNAQRFYNSMKGLYMPPFPTDMYVKATVEHIRRNAEMGFRPQYNAAWEKDGYMTADSVYIRPFSYTEGAIGVGVSAAPSVYMVSSPVSAYFKEGRSDAIVATRVRATPGGTGYIKTAANYVVSALCKHEAEQQGFAECVFLDAVHHKFFEEGSSSNIMFVLRSGSLVTPELGDTILPGITRKSLLELAKDHGINTEERKISVEEVFSEAVECFVCGTAAGATPIQSLTCDGKRVDFNGGKVGEVTSYLQNTLKGIQYGKLPDTKHWCVRVC